MTVLNTFMFLQIAYLISLTAAASCLVGLTHLLGQFTPIPVQIGVAWLLLWVGIDVLFLYNRSTPALIIAMLHQLDHRMYGVECALLGVTRLEKRLSILQNDIRKLKRCNSE